MLCARALVRGLNDAKNRAQQGCAMQFSGITLSISYLINRGYNPNQVKQQFEKVRSIPREDRLAPTNKESKKKNVSIGFRLQP